MTETTEILKTDKIPERGDVRYEVLNIGSRTFRVALTCMASMDGYVMCRQKAAYPKLLTVRAWNQLVK